MSAPVIPTTHSNEKRYSTRDDGMDELNSRPGSTRPDDMLSCVRRKKGDPEPTVRNKLSAVYPYTPLPENFLDGPGGVSGTDCSENSSSTTTLGCAKYGLWNCRYQEDATSREFMRFCHRSIDGTFVIFAYGVGAQTVPTDWKFGPMIIGLGWALLATTAFELTLHCIYRAGTAFTYKVAALRQVATIVGGILVVSVTSWHLRINNVECDPDANWKALHGYERPAKIEYLSCTRSMNAHPPGGILLGLPTMSLHIYAHFFVVGLHIALQIFGEILAQVSPETPGLLTHQRDGELAFRIVIILSYGCISCLVAFAKHRFKQRSFEAAMEVHYQMRASQRKMDAVDSLMVTMVPASALTKLLEGEKVFDYAPHATVLFSDMVSFTKWSSVRNPQQVVQMLSILVREFDILAADMEVSKVKTIGDCYWAVTGIPDHMDRHAEVMIRFGLQMLTRVREEAFQHPEWDYPLEPGQHAAQRRLVQFRTGIHSGPVEAGVLGTQQISYEIFGETSTAANRVEANGQPDRVVVSRRAKRQAEYHGFLPFHFAPYASAKAQATANPTPVGEEAQPAHALLSQQRDMNGSHTSSDADSDDDDDTDPCSKLYLVVSNSDQQGEVRSMVPGEMKSMVSSRGVRPKADEDRAREQRKKYVESHLLKNDGKDGGGNQLSEATKDELMEELKTRKYCCGILAFADATVEAEFKVFAVSELIDARLAGMIAISGFWLLYFFMFLADAASEFSATALLLTVAAHTTMAISTLLTFQRWQELTRPVLQRSVRDGEDGDEGPSVPPKKAQVELQTLGDYVAPSLAQFAGFLWFCSALIAPDSIITNDCIWMICVIIILVQLPANHWPSLSLVGLFLVYALQCVVNIYLKSHKVVSNVNLVVVGSCMICMLLIMNEKRLRVQFLESKVATHFAAKQLVAAKAQEAVLTSMLPDFVIAPLTNWIGSNFDPAKTVVQTLDNVSVAFVRLSAGARSRSFRCSPTDRGHDALRERAMDWLFAGHKAVDVVLSTTKAVEKVKTVGDLIIVAGSFRGHSPAQAAAAMLSAMVRIHGEFDKESVSIGLHVGPVQGIVLGFSRLAFDIFGDTVNTASRVMSHPESRNRIVASTSYLEQLPNAPSTVRSPAANFVSPARADETVEYGPPVEIAAKGKGVLCVREIQHAV